MHSNMVSMTSRRPVFQYGLMKRLSIILLRLSVIESTTLHWLENAKNHLAVKTALGGIRQVVRDSQLRLGFLPSNNDPQPLQLADGPLDSASACSGNY